MKNINIVIIMMIAGATFLGGCAATQQARNTEVSGFLIEYKPLLKAPDDKLVLLRYIKPNVDIKPYKKILLEPITLWGDPEIRATENRQDLQVLADSFFVSLKEKLSKNYETVDKIEPDTLRIQIALTHGEKSKVGLSFVSKAIPQVRMLNTLWSFGSGKPAFTGGVAGEMKITDAETGELLGAVADKRFGGQKLFEKNVFSSWGDVKNVLDYWGDLLVWRMCSMRGDTDCVKPKA
jgi:hypothetical protein